jgi:hypothetical protein
MTAQQIDGADALQTRLIMVFSALTGQRRDWVGDETNGFGGHCSRH